MPLRRQILLPMAIVLLSTVTVVSALNAFLAWSRERQQLEKQIASVSKTLTESNFPLEANVLRQMRGLTGADYVVVNDAGQALAASDEVLIPAAESSGLNSSKVDLSRVVPVAGRRFFHVALRLNRPTLGNRPLMLHVFYSEAAWREARWYAVGPPLAIGTISVALMMVLVTLVAQRVTSPIRELRSQVERIAGGDLRQMPVPPRDDEVRDLVAAVNQLSQRLAQYEEQIRRSERLRTLGTLGSGIAHQIRNAATGCRMAVDLHRRDCPAAENQEPLDVAVRQLSLIEAYIQRFLSLGKPAPAPRANSDLSAVLAEALDLVQPMAQHRGVVLQASLPSDPAILPADRQSLAQMIVNLIVNAIEASPAAATIELRLSNFKPGHYELAVGNPGVGPSPEIQPRLFEPFATDKPGGTGLGLAVARQIAEDHGGAIRWRRQDERTWFVVQWPAHLGAT